VLVFEYRYRLSTGGFSPSEVVVHLRLNNRTRTIININNPNPPGQTNHPPRLEYPTATQEDDANSADSNSSNAKNRFINHSSSGVVVFVLLPPASLYHWRKIAFTSMERQRWPYWFHFVIKKPTIRGSAIKPTRMWYSKDLV
jgi:hypothetical protein